MEQQTFLAEAALVASSIARKGTYSTRAVSKAVGLRMPVHLLIRIDALAAHAGNSRSAMIANLLSVGLEEVDKHLDEQTRVELEPMYVDAARDLAIDAEDAAGEEL